MTEMRQQNNDDVNKYLDRCGIILEDLKEKVSDEGQDFILTLSPSTTTAWNGLNADIRAELALVFKRPTTKKVFSYMAGFHIIARFKPTIMSILLDKEGQLTALDLIKAEVVKIEKKIRGKTKNIY